MTPATSETFFPKATIRRLFPKGSRVSVSAIVALDRLLVEKAQQLLLNSLQSLHEIGRETLRADDF